MYICVDFDGTIVEHEFPYIGRPVPAALETLRVLQLDHKIILFTCRSGEPLQDAVKYLTDEGIELFGINENPDQKEWSLSPKAYGHIYIDDAALGTPLMRRTGDDKKPFVDWLRMHKLLVQGGYLND